MKRQVNAIAFKTFSGAFAAFLLLQIAGFVLFQAFLHIIEHIEIPEDLLNPFILLWFLWPVGLIYFQSEVMQKSLDFIYRGRHNPLESPTRADIVRYLISMAFIAVLLLFFFGYYPFPFKEFDAMHLALFYLFTWIASFVAPRVRYGFDVKSWIGRVFLLVWGFFALSWYFAFGALTQSEPSFFYTFPFLGFCFITAVAISILAD